MPVDQKRVEPPHELIFSGDRAVADFWRLAVKRTLPKIHDPMVNQGQGTLHFEQSSSLEEVFLTLTIDPSLPRFPRVLLEEADIGRTAEFALGKPAELELEKAGPDFWILWHEEAGDEFGLRAKSQATRILAREVLRTRGDTDWSRDEELIRNLAKEAGSQQD